MIDIEKARGILSSFSGFKKYEACTWVKEQQNLVFSYILIKT